jgi:hypothetical protein
MGVSKQAAEPAKADQGTERAPRFPAQKTEIEGIMRRTGFDDDEMLRRLPGVNRTTFYKARMGHQKAGALLMESIRAVERVQSVFDGAPRTSEEPPNKLLEEVQFIMKNGSKEELNLLQKMIEGAYVQVRQRRRSER